MFEAISASLRSRRDSPAGGIADLGGAAAHEHDRAVAGALQQPQQHDLHEAADMQAVGGGVEADIGGDDLARAPARRAPPGPCIDA